MELSDEKLENGYDAKHEEDAGTKGAFVALNTKSGIELSPQPSNDPRDPLVSPGEQFMAGY